MSWIPTFQGLKRALPPIESREAVQARIESESAWVSIDDSDDIQISLPQKRRKLSDHDKHQSRQTVLISTRDVSRRHLTPDRAPFEERQTNYESTASSDRRKPPKNNKFELQPSGATDQPVTKIIQNGRLAPCNNIPQKGGDPIDSADDVQWEARRLAILTSQKPIELEGGHVPVFNQADQKKSPRVDEDDLEKSRELRRKALARRALEKQALERQAYETRSTIDRRQPLEWKTQSDTTDTRATPVIGKNSGLEKSPTLPDQPSPSSRLNRSPNINELFEIARYAARDDSITETSNVQVNTPQINHGQILHPASRAAAEQYRTQDRHILVPTGLPNTEEKSSASHAGEERLRKLTSKRFGCEDTLTGQVLGHDTSGSRQISSVVSNSQTLETSLALCSPKTIPNQFPKQTNLEPSSPHTNGASRFSPPHMPTDANNMDAAQSDDNPSTSICPTQSSYISAETLRPLSNLSRTFTVLDDVVSYPKQGEDLTLPKVFDDYSDRRKQITVEHETEKERHRDLEMILSTLKQVAIFGALDKFTERETKEIKFVHEFTRMVVDHGLSGKRMRKRLSDVRDNMRRRILRRAPNEIPPYQPLLDRLLKPERRQHIEQLIADAEERIQRLSSLRSQVHSGKSKRQLQGSVIREDHQGSRVQKNRKRVRFASDTLNDPYTHLPDGAVVEFPNIDRQVQSMNSTEKRRFAQYAVADKKEAQLRAALARFECGDKENTYSEDFSASQYDNVSDISSEEDEGAEFYTSLDVTQPAQMSDLHIDIGQDSENANNTTNHYQEEESRITTRAEVESVVSNLSRPQRNDEKLVASLRLKEQQRSIQNEQHTQQVDYSLLSVNNGEPEQQEREDGSAIEPQTLTKVVDNHDTFDDGDEGETERICYRYTMKSQSLGIPEYDNDCENEHGSFLDHKAAERHLDALVRDLIDRYYRSQSIGHGTHQQHSKHSDGQFETTLEFGRDSEAYFRTWIERTEYNPDEEEYRNAKVRRACRAKPVYTVLWERIVTPIDTADEDDDDDLFGPDEPSPTTETTVPSASSNDKSTPQITRVLWEQLRFFTSIAAANRHARDIFMRWFMDHLRGSDNFGYILLEEQSVEDQLESYGNKTMWEREEDFDVYEDLEDAREDAAAERKMIENDRFKVWVTEKAVSGPAN